MTLLLICAFMAGCRVKFAVYFSEEISYFRARI